MEQENHYDASIHLSYSDLAVDDPANPSVISRLIKKPKTVHCSCGWLRRFSYSDPRSVGECCLQKIYKTGPQVFGINVFYSGPMSNITVILAEPKILSSIL